MTSVPPASQTSSVTYEPVASNALPISTGPIAPAIA